MILLAGGELAARLWHTPSTLFEREPADTLQAFYQPHRLRQIRETGQGFGQLNNYAFRSRPFDFEKGPDEFRIIIIGGSFATGSWAAEMENTPAAALESALRDPVRELLGKELVVYCLAESSDDIEDEAFWLVKLGFALQPDLVLSVTGYNNMMHGLVDYWDFSSGGRRFERPGIAINPLKDRSWREAWLELENKARNALVEESALIAFVRDMKSPRNEESQDAAPSPNPNVPTPEVLARHLENLKKYGRPDPPPWLPARRFRDAAADVAELCRQRGVDYAVVIQPFRGCGAAMMASLPRDGSRDDREQVLYRTLMQVLEDQPLPCVVWDSNPTVTDPLEAASAFADPCHLWDHGFEMFNAAMGEWVGDHLVETDAISSSDSARSQAWKSSILNFPKMERLAAVVPMRMVERGESSR